MHRLTHREAGNGDLHPQAANQLGAAAYPLHLPLRPLGWQDLDADKVKGTQGSDDRHETTCTTATTNTYPSSPPGTNLHHPKGSPEAITCAMAFPIASQART